MKAIKCSCGTIVGQKSHSPMNKQVLKDELKQYIITYNNECARNEYNFIIPINEDMVYCKNCYRKRCNLSV